MLEVSSSRLPIPHLFMVLTIGIFALMAVAAFAPAVAEDRAATAAGPGSEVVAMDTTVLLASAASSSQWPAAPSIDEAAGAGHGLAGAPLDPAAPAVDRLAIGSLVVLLALLAATIGEGRVGTHGSGRPILGLVSGLLAGVAGATGLFSLGAISLSSPTWVYAPLALATLGTALGLTGPFQRRSAAPPAVAPYPVVTSRSA